MKLIEFLIENEKYLTKHSIGQIKCLDNLTDILIRVKRFKDINSFYDHNMFSSITIIIGNRQCGLWYDTEMYADKSNYAEFEYYVVSSIINSLEILKRNDKIDKFLT